MSRKRLEENDPTLRLDLVRIYLKTTPPLLAQMRRFLEEKNFEQLRRSAHTLKSSSAYVDLSDIRETAFLLEKLEDARSTQSEAEALLKKIETAFKTARVILEEELRRAD